MDEEDPKIGRVTIRAGFHCGPVGKSVLNMQRLPIFSIFD